MGRMQVLRLGLVLMLSCAAQPPFPWMDGDKILGLWYHVFTASNQLQDLRDENYLRLYKPLFHSLNRNILRIWLWSEYRYQVYCRSVMYDMEMRFNRSYPTWVSMETHWKTFYSMDDAKFPPVNILDLVQVSDSLLLLRFVNRLLGSSSGDTYTVVALGRESTLSEADMAEFQKALRDNGTVAEPVHFTGDEFCMDGDMSKE